MTGPRLSAAARVVAFALVLTGCAREPESAAPDPTAPPPPRDAAATDPVDGMAAAIEGLPVGRFTIGDLALPRPFLEHLAQRAVRDQYRERFQALYVDPQAVRPPVDAPPRDAVVRPRGNDLLRVDYAEVDADTVAFRRGLREERPGRRGFRAPILAAARDARGPHVAWSELDADEQRAAVVVGQGLAREGLLVTTVRALRILGVDATTTQLERVGLPLDLIGAFDLPTGDGLRALRELARRPLDDDTMAVIRATPFRFRPTLEGFRVAPESGETPIDSIRLHLTRGDHWRAPEAGDALDVARQLLDALPETVFTIVIEDRFVARLLETTTGWTPRPRPVSVIGVPYTVSQWAQDAGKPGTVTLSGAPPRPALLVPRYVSRGEEAATFVPGDSFALEPIGDDTVTRVHSPLLFQGGDLLPVLDPATGELILLLGEAELWRNAALGLTAEQVQAAFAVELGVDRVVTVPAASFHLDYDVTVRAVDDRLVAFVNDAESTARLVLAAAADAWARAGVLPVTQRDAIRAALQERNDDAAIAGIAPLIASRARSDLVYPLSLAQALSGGPADSGPGAFHRVLVAMDVLANAELSEANRPTNPVARAYSEILAAEAARRAELVSLFESLGWTVVPVPGLPAEERGIVYVNGVHAPGIYLMPVTGGVFAPVDEAARKAFSEALGPSVRVVPVRSAESQRRCGAVHCATMSFRSSIAGITPRQRSE